MHAYFQLACKRACLFGSRQNGLPFGIADFNAVLMQVRSGSGKTFLLRPKSAVAPSVRPLQTVEAAEPIGSEKVPEISQQEAEANIPEEYGLQVSDTAIPEAQPASQATSVPESVQEAPEATTAQEKELASERAGAFVSAEAPPISPPVHERQKEIPQGEKPQPTKPPIQKTKAGFLLKINAWINRLASSLQGFFKSMLPEDWLPSLSPVALAAIAITVPLIVVAIATLIYFRSGRQSQYELYFQQAEQLAGQAGSQVNAFAGRQQWEEVLDHLDQAGKYGTSAEAEALRSQAETALDEADGIVRLDFQNAVSGGFPSAVQISRMAASNTELFMLDAKTGSILRVFSTTGGYEKDDDFECGPHFPGAEGIGLLIDFALFNRGSQGTTILLAMDSKGNLLQCSVGNSPEKIKLQAPPTGLGMLKGFTLDQGNFYLLDPDKNAVWIYWKSNFDEEPELFFGENVPQMKDVIDLAVDQDDLYLLHSDGHLTLCTYSNLSVSPTHCESPVPFRDSRPGRENRILIPETPVTQIFASQPPDPSLYFMEPGHQAIYHLSLRSLTFHQQFRPSRNFYSNKGEALPASAFAISPDGREVFLAFSNQVYYSPIP